MTDLRNETVIFTGNALYLGLNGELRNKAWWLRWGKRNNVKITFMGGQE